MPDDVTSQAFLEINFRRRLRKGTLTREGLEDIAADAAARMIAGSDVMEVTIEGGTTRAVQNCPVAITGLAAEVVLAETDPENAYAGTSPRDKYADLSGGIIET